MKTRNTLLFEKGLLREVDEFALRRGRVLPGKWTFYLILGELRAVPGTLCADHDDLQKIKGWMEAIARDERHASVTFGSGAGLTCDITDIPESSVKKSYRYLDEEHPSPIALLTVTDDNGSSHSAVLKIKHFINYLYVVILFMSFREEDNMKEQWYAYTPKYRESEEFQTLIREHPYYHQDLQSSALVEWYLQSAECYSVVKPQFRYAIPCAYLINMWVDFGCMFWEGTEGMSIGEYSNLYINDLQFDFSDIDGLDAWIKDFHRLAERSMKVDGFVSAKLSHTIKAWHLRGYKIAQEIRKRLPLNVILIYQQAFDLSFRQRYYRRDLGRVLFPPALLKSASD